MEHGAFWRTAWQFLIVNASAIDRAQIAPIIDFLHGIRHECVEVETAWRASNGAIRRRRTSRASRIWSLRRRDGRRGRS
jgi:hypothetical protein